MGGSGVLGDGEATERLTADRMARPRPDRPTVLVHGVSLGEINATRTLVRALAGEPPRSGWS